MSKEVLVSAWRLNEAAIALELVAKADGVAAEGGPGRMVLLRKQILISGGVL